MGWGNSVSGELATLGVFSRPTLRMLGESGIELKLFLQNDLISTKFFDWPSLEEIKELTLSRNLNVGRKFAVEATNCDTIEDEAATILKQIMKPQHEEAMLKRFGLNDECIQWTLQEVANEGFSNGAQITRERVRQIESIYIKKLKNTFYSAKKCEGVNAYLKDLPFISNSSLQNYLGENNFTKANNGFALVCRLRNLGFLCFDHEVIDIRWVNAQFLVKNNFLTYFSKFFEQIKRKLTGRIFVNVDKLMDDIVPEEDRNSFLQILTNEREQFKNIVFCSDEGKWFVAKRAHRLASHGLGRDGVRTNSLVSTLTLIFSVCREVNFNFLYKGVCRDRKTRENLSPNLLREYLSYCPFLEVRGDQITCLKRPKFDGQRSRDFLIVDFMRSEGVDTMPSNRVVKFLVQQGLSSNSATVLIHTTPLVINLNSGRGPVEGLLRLVCDKDSVDIISGNAVSSSVSKNLEFTVPNNPALRITGRATVPKLETEDGQYQVFDMDENHLADIMLRGNKMHGLRELAGKNSEKDLQFIFEEDHFLFK